MERCAVVRVRHAIVQQTHKIFGQFVTGCVSVSMTVCHPHGARHVRSTDMTYAVCVLCTCVLVLYTRVLIYLVDN